MDVGDAVFTGLYRARDLRRLAAKDRRGPWLVLTLWREAGWSAEFDRLEKSAFSGSESLVLMLQLLETMTILLPPKY